jgi:hypothetical protein
MDLSDMELRNYNVLLLGLSAEVLVYVSLSFIQKCTAILCIRP